MEMIRSTVATEELIGQKICSRAKLSEIQSVNKDSQTAGMFRSLKKTLPLPFRSLLFTYFVSMLNQMNYVMVFPSCFSNGLIGYISVYRAFVPH